jgi:hypothetical protein
VGAREGGEPQGLGAAVPGTHQDFSVIKRDDMKKNILAYSLAVHLAIPFPMYLAICYDTGQMKSLKGTKKLYTNMTQ